MWDKACAIQIFDCIIQTLHFGVHLLPCNTCTGASQFYGFHCLYQGFLVRFT